MSATQQPILTVRSAEAASKAFSRRNNTPESNEAIQSDGNESDEQDQSIEAGRPDDTTEKDLSSPLAAFSDASIDDRDFKDMKAFDCFEDQGSDDDLGFGEEFQPTMADLRDVSPSGSFAVSPQSATTRVPKMIPGIPRVIDDVGPLAQPPKVVTVKPDVVIIDDVDPAIGSFEAELPPTGNALFLRIREQLENDVCLYDDVLWYSLWSAMPSARDLVDRNILLVDPLALSIDTWSPTEMHLKVPKVLRGKLAPYTIYTPIHHRRSEHWTAVQVVVSASRVTVSHFDSLFDSQRSLRVKELFDVMFRDVCPGSEIEFVEAVSIPFFHCDPPGHSTYSPLSRPARNSWTPSAAVSTQSA